MRTDDPVDKLLSHYRLWGIAAVCSFMLFITLLMVLAFVPDTPLGILYIVLVCGFLWLGSTSFSRHVLVVLKRYIGCELGLVEFLSTQFVAILFPFAYTRVKKEVGAFKQRQSAANGR